MKNIIFENIVKNNGIIIKVNSNNEKLTTKQQFIDDMLQRETTENIQDCLQSLASIKQEYQTEWSIVRMYCNTIKGLDNAIFLEMTASTLTEARATDSNSIEQLKQQRIKFISDFANYLYR